MKQKILLLILGVLLSLPAMARDFEYTYEGQTITYTVIDEDAKTCRTKWGEMGSTPKPGNHVYGELTLPDHPKDGNVEYTLTTISDNSFSTCSGLTAVVIPNTVTTIGNHAFFECANLWHIVIPNSVTSIGLRAFKDCINMNSVIIGNSVTELGFFAFEGCDRLIKSAYPNNLQNPFPSGLNVAYEPIQGSIIENGWIWGPGKNQVLFAPYYAADESILPETVTSIGAYAFAGCTYLKKLDIPESVTTIKSNAFNGCKGLTYLVIPNSVTTIGTQAFSNCSNLETVLIGNSVSSIATSAFNDCSALIKSAYPKSIKNPFKNGICVGYNPEDSFIEDGWIWGPNKTEICFAPYTLKGEYQIPGTVNTIGPKAFYGCKELTSVVISDSVRDIDESSFQECLRLETVTFGNSVKTIGISAFEQCYKLTSIDFPASLTTIGENAFIDCSKIISISIPASMIEIGEKAFDRCNNVKELNYDAANCNVRAVWPSSIEKVTFGDNVQSIPNYCFSNLKNLTSIVIPASVTSIEKGAFLYCQNLKSVVYNAENSTCPTVFPSTVESLIIGEKVTTIPDYFFSGNTLLSSLAIPNSVKSIGNNAFEECIGLTSIEIPNSVISIGEQAFRKCENLLSVIIGNSVTAVGDLAFFGCSELTSIIIPDSVISIGHSVFSGCSSLTSVEIGNSVTSIKNYTFYNCSAVIELKIGKSVTSIGESAFQNCSGLTFLDIPNSVTSIGNYAFSGCSGLTSVILPSSVTFIGSDAFKYCSGLIKSAYPNNLYNPFKNGIAISYNPEVAIIEDGWIWGPDKSAIYFAPYSLEGEYTILDSVTSIGNAAFSGCSKLSSVIIPNSVTSIGEEAFSRCSGLTSVIIPSSVTSIGDGAFINCSGLIKSAYPNNLYNPFKNGIAISYNPEVALIEDGWIWSADKSAIYFAPYSLEGEFTIPKSVTLIGDGAFSVCSGLTSVEIPNSVTSIGSNAFKSCNSLTYITALPTKPAVMDKNSFEGLYDNANLLLSEETVTNYLTTNWSLFKNISTTSGAELKTYSDGVLEYRLNPADTTATVIGAKSYGNLQIPERFTDESDAANPVRYYIKGVGYHAFKDKDVKSVEFNSRSQMEYIGQYAFAGTKITSIDIPSTVTSIGEGAFLKSTLSQVDLKEGLKSIELGAFQETQLISAIIPSTVTTIGNQAFYKSALAEVEIKDGVTSIGKHAFAETKLSSISIPGSVSFMGDYAFYKSAIAKAELKEGVKTIGYGSFAETNLSSISIPGSVSFMGDYAFYKAPITEVEIKEGVPSIASYAFAETKISSISIPESVKTIEDYAFYNTLKLSEVKLAEGIEFIGNCAFKSSTNRTVTERPLYIPSTIQTISGDAFKNFVCSQVEISSLKAWCSIDFEDFGSNPLSACGNFAIDGNTVTNLQISEDIDEIKPYAFAGFTMMKTLYIHDSVKVINEYGFMGCTGLKTITFGKGIDTILAECFNGCTGVTSVTFSDTAVPIAIAYESEWLKTIKNLYMGRPINLIQ